jgi:hypothetical protein
MATSGILEPTSMVTVAVNEVNRVVGRGAERSKDEEEEGGGKGERQFDATTAPAKRGGSILMF